MFSPHFEDPILDLLPDVQNQKLGGFQQPGSRLRSSRSLIVERIVKFEIEVVTRSMLGALREAVYCTKV